MRLTRAQLDCLADTLSRHLGFLCRLKERMDRIGWPPTDAMRVEVEAAYNALHSLTVEIRYRAAEAGRRD